MGIQLVIPKARLSYPTLGEPERYQGKPENKPRYGASFYIPKTDTATIAAVDAAVREVAKEMWPKTWEKLLPEILIDRKGCCWIDGKRKDEDTAGDYWTLTSYRDAVKGPPLVYDSNMEPIYKEDRSLHPGKAGKLYAGVWVKGKVEIWAQDNKTGKGIRAGLLVVQRLQDAPAFGGGAQPSPEGFGAVEDGADADDISE